MDTPPNRPPLREGFVEVPGAAATIEPPQAPATNGQAGTPVPSGPVPDHWPVVVKLLKKPIQDNKGLLVREVSFREPTGGDINRIGNPVRVDLNGEIIIDDSKMIRMIAALSGILQPMIEHMDPRDYASCAYRLRGFFLPDPEAW
jgi:Phage tail assembly chaperone proteins, E, or 41 or 14